MKLKDLTPNPKNPRKITDSKLSMLKKSMDEFGELNCILFNVRTKQLEGGHQRLKILPSDADIVIMQTYDPPTRTGTVAEGHVVIGGEKFKYRAVDWDQDKAKAANIAANKHGGEWDFTILNEVMLELDSSNYDMDLTGFDSIEIENQMTYVHDVEKIEPQCDEDEVPERVEPRTRLGDIIQLGVHRLMCGDSTSIDAIENLMNGEKAELCFTSPPYADQRQYNDKSLDLDINHIASFITNSCSMVKTYAVVLGLMRRDGNIEPYWNAFICTAKNNGLPFLSWNVWNKGYSGSIGNASAMFTIDHEWIFIFGQKKELNRTVPNKYAGDIADHSWTRQQDGTIKKAKTRIINSHRQLGTVIQCNPEKQSTLYKHPAMYPVELPEKYIEACTNIDEVVYEPFGGSGTTLIACEKTNRRCFMMEIDPHYCDIIVARWEKYTGKKAVLIHRFVHELSKSDDELDDEDDQQ